MKKHEQALQDLVLGWMISLPFDESAPELHLLQSGVIASPEVLEDLRNALKEGENSLTSVFFESKDKKKIISCYYTH